MYYQGIKILLALPIFFAVLPIANVAHAEKELAPEQMFERLIGTWEMERDGQKSLFRFTADPVKPSSSCVGKHTYRVILNPGNESERDSIWCVNQQYGTLLIATKNKFRLRRQGTFSNVGENSFRTDPPPTNWERVGN